MRRILLNLCLVLLLIGVITSTVACAESSTVLRQPVAEVETYDLTVVKTVGNHSYAPLYFRVFPQDDSIDKVLGFLQVFEKAHPELEITEWRVQETNGALWGIWIDHRPKR